MKPKLRMTAAYWVYSAGGLIVALWVAPAINQLRFSYYPNGPLGGLIKVDRLTGRMEVCVLAGQYHTQVIRCLPGKP